MESRSRSQEAPIPSRTIPLKEDFTAYGTGLFGGFLGGIQIWNYGTPLGFTASGISILGSAYSANSRSRDWIRRRASGRIPI